MYVGLLGEGVERGVADHWVCLTVNLMTKYNVFSQKKGNI